MTLLQLRDLTLDVPSSARAPGGKRLLDGISLSVEPGTTVGLVGESGSGKSLTARTPLGLFPEKAVVSGRVEVDGQDVLTSSAAAVRSLRRTKVAMVFQDARSGINPVRTLGDHLTEAQRLNGSLTAAQAKSKALELMEAVRLPRPEHHFNQYPHELSGGQLQRVMIAGALMGDPELLVCDEPTTALDVTTQAEIVRLLRALRDERGMGMLFITHDLGLAAALCDDVVVMRAGRVEERGSMAGVLADPQADYTRALLAATPSVDTVRSTVTSPNEAAQAAADGSDRAQADHEASGMALTITDVSRTYHVRGQGEVHAVANADVALRPGGSLGIVGESGSGKSTLARMIVGLESPDSGEIRVGGRDFTRPARGKRARLERAKAVQMVFQDPYLSLDPRIPVVRAVRDALELHGGGGDVEAAALLERVGLTREQMRALPRTLSGGQRQRVALARAVAVQPELLVMDEATSALDVSVQAQVLELVAELRAERGLTVLFISHDLGVVRQVCDETMVLRAGRIVEAGPTEELLSNPQNEYTQLLLDSVPRPAQAA
ncbi:MAG: dipeptide ABC transporter ATP-binding protein [Galactobacter sp.]